MRNIKSIRVLVILCALLTTCKDRLPLNPLDPENSSTKGKPYTLQAKIPGIGKVKLNWRRINQSQVKGYRVYRKINDGLPSAIADVTDTAYFDTHLQPHTAYSYFFRLIWKDGRELHQSPNATAVTFNAPTGFTMTKVSRDRVEMQWDDLHWLGNYAYCRIYRSIDFTFTIYDSTTSNRYEDTKVERGKIYRYKVIAVASDGCLSNFSDEVSVTAGNNAPVVSSFQLSQPITGWGETVTITCFAQDSDGDSIHYSWQALDGGNIDGARETITFQVPVDDLSSHRVIVTVFDDFSTGDSDTISVRSAQLLLSENFGSYSVGTFPSSGGWTLVWNGAGNSYQVVTNMVSASPPNSMQMKGASGWSANMDRNIRPGLAAVVWFEVKMRIAELGDGGVSVWNRDEILWGKRYCALEFMPNGQIRIGYYDGVWYYKTIADYVPDRWYKVKVKYNVTFGLADVWIDDTLKTQNHQVLKGGQGYRQIMLSGGWSGKLLYYDDVKVWIQ